MNKEQSRIAFKEALLGRVSGLGIILSYEDEIKIKKFIDKISIPYETQIKKDFLKEILPPMERCVKSKRNEYRQEIINKAKNKWGINL